MLDLTAKSVALLWFFCAILSLIGAAYSVLAAICISRFAQKKGERSEAFPSVTVMKPLYGAEPDLEANLASFCRQIYASKVQIVCGVHELRDSAVAIVERLKRRFPETDIVLVADPKRHGGNPKISNLINMMRAVKHGLIVVSDSDIKVEGDYLDQIAAGLSQHGAGLVTCLYRGTGDRGFWSKLAAAAIDQHFLPNVLVGLALGLAKPCFGSTIAIRTETLEAIGGFEAFVNQLADDYAIGEAVRSLGLTVVIPPMLVEHICSETSFRQLLQQELRWARTIGSIEPKGYLGLALTNPLPFALIAAALSGFHLAEIGLIALALACRSLIPIQLRRIGGGEAHKTPLWLTPLRDLLSFAIYLASLLPGPVMWRGHRFELQSDGTLTPS